METQHKFKVLIVDDNPAILQDFIKILTAKVGSSELDKLNEKIFGEKNTEISMPSLLIDCASQGQEAVQKVKEAIKAGNPYALAFVDIRMPPGWDGIETIKHIWKLDSDIQIVICTAYSDYSWEETVSNLGQTDNLLILKKPFDNVAVRQLACALTKKWKLLQEQREYASLLEQKVTDRTTQLQHQATHDYLTGLPNRLLLIDEIRDHVIHAKHSHQSFALLFIDIDRFKLINDSLSHSVGDAILCSVTDRLQRTIEIEKGDLLARLGGDEFVILLSDISNQEDIIQKSHKILDAFHKTFLIENREITVSVSIGISIYPKDGEKIDTLLKNADTAMYQAKEMKGGTFQFYSAEMGNENLAKLDMEIDLRHAIEHNEFFLCYQPQFNLLTEKLVAVEALIRWNHPTKGLLQPDSFIPIAEETGLITTIGEWVLRTACYQAIELEKINKIPVRIAVNVTANQIKQHNLPDIVKKVLAETKLKPEYLELEFTENIIINDISVLTTMDELKKIGVIIAIDDFGTGFTSLGYLKSISLDRLKIDKSFIQNIRNEKDDEVIIRAIIAIAKNLNIEVIAEGVETKNQLEFLKKHECKDVQGFYFSKPLSIEELKKLIEAPLDQRYKQMLIENETKA